MVRWWRSAPTGLPRHPNRAAAQVPDRLLRRGRSIAKGDLLLGRARGESVTQFGRPASGCTPSGGSSAFLEEARDSSARRCSYLRGVRRSLDVTRQMRHVCRRKYRASRPGRQPAQTGGGSTSGSFTAPRSRQANPRTRQRFCLPAMGGTPRCSHLAELSAIPTNMKCR